MKPERQQPSAPLKRRIRLDTILTAVGLFISFSLFVTTQLNGMEERISARFDSRFDSLETSIRSSLQDLDSRVGYLEGQAGTANDVPAVPPN